MAIRGTGRVREEPRPRILVQAGAGSRARWLDALAARPDLAVDRIAETPDPPSLPPESRLAILELPANDRIRRVRTAAPEMAIIAVLSTEDSPLPTGAGESAERAREEAFAAGATDVVFLPDDADRFEEAICHFAGVNARRYTRYRVRLPVQIQPGDEPLRAVVENLSVGGLQIRVTGPIEIGSVIRIALPIRKGDALLDTWGLVRGVLNGSNSAIARMRFVGMRSSERAELENYLGTFDASSRSIEPADAIVSVRRLDAAWLKEALAEPQPKLEWLTTALPSLSPSERAAISASGDGASDESRTLWADVGVARCQAAALTEALEKYDPALDDEPTAVREAVIETVRRLRTAANRFDRWSEGQPGSDIRPVADALIELSGRLDRAIAARLPHLSGAFDRVSGLVRLEHLERLENEGRDLDRFRARNRLIAALAGVLLGGAIVYAVVATLVARR